MRRKWEAIHDLDFVLDGLSTTLPAERSASATLNPTSPDTHRRRFLPNTAARVGLLVFHAVATLWFTRYLIDSFGTELYGLVPMAMSMIASVGVSTELTVAPLGRFLAADIASGDTSAANRTFNSGLRLVLMVVAWLLVPALGFAYVTPWVFNIPPGAEWAARGLFAGAALAFLLTATMGCFSASTFAKNRLDLGSLQELSGTVVRIGLAAGLIAALGWGLPAVAVGILAGGVAQAAITLRNWHTLTPELFVRLGQFDRARSRKIGGMTWHMLVNSVGTVLFLNVDIVVANLILGADACGRYGAILQVSLMLRGFGLTFAGAVSPSMAIFHALGQYQAIVSVMSRAIKWLGLLMAVPVGLLCGYAQPLLVVWLGEGFRDMYVIFVVLVAHLSVNLAIIPLFSVNVALNRVRIPAYVTLGMGVVNVGLAVLLALPRAGLGLLGIAIAGGAVLLCKNLLFTPIYAAFILRVPWYTFIKKLVVPVIAFFVIWGFAAAMASVLEPRSWVSLLAALGGTGAVSALAVWLGALSRQERSWMINTLRRRDENNA